MHFKKPNQKAEVTFEMAIVAVNIKFRAIFLILSWTTRSDNSEETIDSWLIFMPYKKINNNLLFILHHEIPKKHLKERYESFKKVNQKGF